ncbi:hypothetical protein KKB44_06255 [Candidatus Micrarchaeota archaeon]|nr:hypothetical protein [Candidatus Micrarchaeota archaeon]
MLASRQRILWEIPRNPKFSWIVPLTSSNNRAWRVMSDDELVKYARKFIEEEGISGLWKLSKADSGLYYVLWKRKLLDRIGLEDKKRDWNSMNDEELVEYAKRFMEENEISERRELEKTDSGLYGVLKRRRLLDRVGFEDKMQKKRNWKSMSDEELVEYAKRFMEEKEINGRKDLWKADSGLYTVLWKRKLLDRVGFEEKRQRQRDWNSMNDDEIVEYAKKFIEENGISEREELKKADRGLHQVLKIRKLLDTVFASIDQSRRKEGILQVVEAMEEFAC